MEETYFLETENIDEIDTLEAMESDYQENSFTDDQVIAGIMATA